MKKNPICWVVTAKHEHEASPGRFVGLRSTKEKADELAKEVEQAWLDDEVSVITEIIESTIQ